jgi:transcriptional regulator with XRE-family HTH domain
MGSSRPSRPRPGTGTRVTVDRRCHACNAPLAADNTARLCSRCHRDLRDQLGTPPTRLRSEFFGTGDFLAAFESQHIGRVFKAYRNHPRYLQLLGKALNQEILGRWLGLTQAQVSKLENGKPEHNLETLRNYAQVLGLPQHLLWFDLPGQNRRATPTGSDVTERNPSPELLTPMHTGSPSDSEEVADVLARVRTLTRVGSDELNCLELSVADFVDRYESDGPMALAPLLIDQRHGLESAIDECRSPSQRKRLFRVAGQVSGLLAYMAVNRGRHVLARAYCTEAAHLSDFAEDRDLLAWVKGTESFCEYYDGNYGKAVALARAGLEVAGSGPQRVRLLINGEARALGKLGDVAGVHVAVERAYDAASGQPTVPGVSPCVSFGGYSMARLASNAVTAYVDLGLTDQVAVHAEQAMEEFDSSESSWSQSLIRLDLANAMVTGDGDPVEAAGLITTALTISSDKPIASVVQRSRAFVRSTSGWRGIPAVADAHDLVRTVAQRLRMERGGVVECPSDTHTD